MAAQGSGGSEEHGAAAGVGGRPAGLGRWVRHVLARLRRRAPPMASPVVTTDRGIQLAEQRTGLALDRSFLAAERTLMAWIRTSLSMISFGFTIVKFFEYIEEQRKVDLMGVFGHSYGPASLGLTLITIGTLALVAAVLQHRQALRGLRQRGLTPRWSLALAVAAIVAVLGVFAFGSLVLKY